MDYEKTLELVAKEKVTSTLYIAKNKDQFWYNDRNVPHREDGPAVEYYDGSKFWYINGQYHRTDGPAIEYNNGNKQWLFHNKLHREDGPAYEFANGNAEWWIHNRRHRLDGPAIDYVNGNREWWVDGERHRLDGPALEYCNGSKASYWYYKGERIRCKTQEEFLQLIKLKAFW